MSDKSDADALEEYRRGESLSMEEVFGTDAAKGLVDALRAILLIAESTSLPRFSFSITQARAALKTYEDSKAKGGE